MSTIQVQATPELLAALEQAIDYTENLARISRNMQLFPREAELRGHVLELSLIKLQLLRAEVLKQAGGGV